MKLLIKKIYIILFFLTILFAESQVFSKDSKIQYTRENLSNYFSGIISVNKNHNDEAFKHLNKIQKIKKKHSQFNVNLLGHLFSLKNLNKHLLFQKACGL